MTKHKHGKDHEPDKMPEVQEVRAPYWARAHRDWRFLAVVLLMLAAIAIYVLSGNLAWGPRRQALPMIETVGQ